MANQPQTQTYRSPVTLTRELLISELLATAERLTTLARALKEARRAEARPAPTPRPPAAPARGTYRRRSSMRTAAPASSPCERHRFGNPNASCTCGARS
ncbi:MAG TPA: hypothetical protein VN613_08525 [Gemmatimonadaceae bacterium]|nr:hypothetical protein [Gemmatimonadaceae bacterium]